MSRLLCLLLAVPLFAAPPEAQIRQVLDDQVAAWNRGDIPGFMQGYDNSDSTTFVSSSVTKGHAQVLANYIKRYPTREKMGTLRFSDIAGRQQPPFCPVISFIFPRDTVRPGLYHFSA